MYKRWVKRDGEELWAPLDDNGRVVMAAQRASMGPGECVGLYYIDEAGAARIGVATPDASDTVVKDETKRKRRVIDAVDWTGASIDKEGKGHIYGRITKEHEADE